LPRSDETPRGRRLSRLTAAEAAEAALYQDESEPAAANPEAGGLADRARRLARASLPRGAVILGVLFVVNAGMAVLRDKVLAHTFGAGPELDAFFTALFLPQLVLEFLVVGGVVGPFLPIFVGLKGEAEATARDFARTILTGSMIAMAAAMALVIVFAPQTASFVAPGYVGDQRELYIGLLRVMALGQIVFAASFVLGEVLVAERRFLSYGLGDFAYNAGIVAGAMLLSGPFGIYGAAIGFLLGALGHLGVRLVGIYSTSFRPQLSLSLRTKGLGEFVRLSLPKMISQPMGTLMLIYFGSLASTLAPGSATSFNFARNFQSVGESVVGLAFATAAFPALSAASAAGDRRVFKRVFKTNLATIAFFSTCAGVGLLLFGGFAIRILLSGGAFDETDVARTTMVLMILAISVPFESLVELFARAIFATHNTVEPTVAAAVGFLTGVLTTMTLSTPAGLAAIPIGYVACRVAQLTVLAFFLRPRMARIGGASRWSRAVARDRWGGIQGANRRASPAGASPAGASPAGSRPTGQVVVMAILLVALTAGTLFAGAQALSHSSIGGEPQTTPWARTNGTREPVLTLPPATPSVTLSASASAQVPSTTASATPSGTPGIFVMDLYREGDFVSEFNNLWCVPAAMQTSMNMMSAEPDISHDTQAKLFDLAVSIGGSQSGGADPEGWAAGLASLGYGNYQVGAKLKMVDAIHTVAKQIRITQRPAGLLVWRGWHSWVVSGFTATADPATTDKFTVLSVRIEDVWYPRVSTLWPKSRPPDADVPVADLAPDYKTWVQAKFIQGRDGYFVYVIPVV
jgi:putative peptidoglycan lipid II flippase